MTTTWHSGDLRPFYRDAVAWVHDLITGVRADQLTNPTPCPQFDVRALLGHLVAGVSRATAVGEGGDPLAAPTVLARTDDDWAHAYTQATERFWAVWADDERLDTPVRAPWGTVPGRAALPMYLNEALVHGWDLAVATGQDPEAPAAVAESALAVVPSTLTASPRGGRVPFGPVVKPGPDAGATERLANWCGRTRP